MKNTRTTKIFIRILLAILTIIIIIGLSFYLYISSLWKDYYTENEIKEYVKIIENSPGLSDNFYAIYDKLNNNNRHKSIITTYVGTFCRELFSDGATETTCWFVRTAEDFAFQKKTERSKYQRFILGFGLQKYTTSEKCFDFCLYTQNEELKENYKELYIQDITRLADTTEIIKYFLISKTPGRFIRNPKLLETKVPDFIISTIGSIYF